MRRSPLLYALLLLALLIPAAATGTGSLTIPNTLAALPGSPATNPIAVIDTNFSTIATYVNDREITSGTAAARPVAAKSGRFYFSTDTSGGTLYVDTGAAWTQLSPGVSSGTGAYAVRNLVGATATATNTTYNVTADVVVLKSPTDSSLVTRNATVSISNSVLTSGPAANGRDQSSAFTVASWVHFYYIWNGSTLASLSSACAPSDVNGACSPNFGPTLPSTYTHWAYIGPLRFATTGTLNAMFARGGKFLPAFEQTPLTGVSITTSEATISLVNFVPPNAATFAVFCSGNTTANLSFGAMTQGLSQVTSVGAAAPSQVTVELPNLSQQLFFQGSAASSTLKCDLQSYSVPNGG